MSSGFSTHEISRLLGLSPTRLRAYVKAGLLCPQRGKAGELRFSFQDLLLLRTAEGLVTPRLPPRRVRDALRRLRRRLPTEHPLTGVHLESDGGHVLVRDGGTTWRADSGQGLLSFDDVAPPSKSAEASSPISTLRKQGVNARTGAQGPGGTNATDGARPADAASATLDASSALDASPAFSASNPTADDFYQLGCSLEEAAPEAARVAYQNVLTLDPRHADAHVNLGRLMHESGDLEFAEEHYRAALTVRPTDTTAHFNLGVVLEDRGRPESAVEMYEATVRVDPSHADAHFNAARLHDLAGRYEAALRHLREYRKLTSG